VNFKQTFNEFMK